MKKMKIDVCGHYVLVKPERMEKMTKGGIYIPDANRKREDAAATRGHIIGIGINAWKAFDSGEPWAKVGDYVYFKQYVADKIIDDDDLDEAGDPQEYFLMVDENILAVIGEQDEE